MEESSQACGWIGKHTGGKEKGSMNSKLGLGRFLAAMAALVFVAAACGSSGGGGKPSPASHGTLPVARFNFPPGNIPVAIPRPRPPPACCSTHYKPPLGNHPGLVPPPRSHPCP